MRKLTLITLIIMLNSQAWAAATPQASRYDARIQQVIYNPQNVTVVNTKPGFMTTLVFDNDEAVISASPGFDEAWEARADANRVNIRPVALTQGAPGEDGNTTQVVIPPNSRDWHTNMLIVTNKRLYNVELNVIDEKSPQQPAYLVSYRYPGDERNRANKEAAARQKEWEQKQEQTQIQKALRTAQTPRNWDYTKYPEKTVTTLNLILPTTTVALRFSDSHPTNQFHQLPKNRTARNTWLTAVYSVRAILPFSLSRKSHHGLYYVPVMP